MREFTAAVVKKGRIQSYTFREGLKRKVTEFLNIASKSINEKTSIAISRLEDYKRKLANKEAVLSDLRTKLNIVKEGLSQLKKFED